jgi:hypothetical protein
VETFRLAVVVAEHVAVAEHGYQDFKNESIIRVLKFL